VDAEIVAEGCHQENESLADIYARRRLPVLYSLRSRPDEPAKAFAKNQRYR
jgi:hypothetical protein